MNDSRNNIYARWVSGDLNPEELNQLRVSGELYELDSIVNAADEFILPEIDLDNIYPQVIAKSKASPKRVPMYRRLTGVAAIIVGLISIYVISQLGTNQVLVEAPYGETITHRLPDNSTVLINDGSLIRYDNSEFMKNRIIELEGEALFKVATGSSFQVQTKNGSVEVLGTIFNVKSWQRSYQVDCYEGVVQVSNASKSIVLRAQESVQLRGSALQKVSIEHSEPFWSRGISIFDKESIYMVLEELERQFNVIIDYNGENKTFNGAFSHKDLDSALQAVCLPLGLTFQIDPETRNVLIE